MGEGQTKTVTISRGVSDFSSDPPIRVHFGSSLIGAPVHPAPCEGLVKAMKAMKAMKGGRAMPKSEIFGAIEAKCGVKKKDVKAVFGALESIIPDQLKATGKFTIPGITMIKLKKKAATKATTRLMFGEMKKIGAKPAKTLVKCYTVKALKDSF